jgi:hypothetical protein
MPRNDFYETVPAGQTAQEIGGTGGVADFISHILVVPATTSPGAITLIDGGTSFTVFTGGTVSDIRPFHISLMMYSKNGAWKVTTGSNVSVVAVGTFGA